MPTLLKKTISRTTLSLLSASFICSGALLPITYANAADDVLEATIIKKSNIVDTQVVFVPFSGSSTFSQRVLDGLRFQSLKVTSDGLVQEAHSSQDLSGSLPAWQQLGIPYLVIGSTGNDRGRSVANFEVVEVATGRIMQGPQQIIERDATTAARKVAVRIFEIITGKQSDLDAKIIYIEETGSGKYKTSSLVIRDADGSNPRELTRVTNASIFSPAASPDGRYVAYSVQFEKNYAELFRLSLTNPRAKPEKLVNLKGSSLSPSYSPDGGTLLFSNSVEGDTDIYRVSSSGGRPAKVLDLPYQQVQPSYSPDGRSFYFGSDHTNPNNISIYRYAFEGSPIKVSHSGNGANPDVSPDGTKIGYLNGGTAAVMDTSGNNIASFGNTGIDEAPSFSPSSERVVYSKGRGNSTIVISSLTGGPTITRRANGVVRSPVWVPSID